MLLHYEYVNIIYPSNRIVSPNTNSFQKKLSFKTNATSTKSCNFCFNLARNHPYDCTNQVESNSTNKKRQILFISIKTITKSQICFLRDKAGSLIFMPGDRTSLAFDQTLKTMMTMLMTVNMSVFSPTTSNRGAIF